jgi:hypothetical protein
MRKNFFKKEEGSRRSTELCHPRQGREAAAGDSVLIQVFL